ncbi:hypothetical protein, partial [Lyngbya confervoides]
PKLFQRDICSLGSHLDVTKAIFRGALEQIRIFRDEHGIEPEATLTTVQKQAEKDPMANSNFLKVAFLEGCHRIGIF